MQAKRRSLGFLDPLKHPAWFVGRGIVRILLIYIGDVTGLEANKWRTKGAVDARLMKDLISGCVPQSLRNGGDAG